MEIVLKLLALIVVVAAFNLPFGAYRNTCRKLSVAWFAAIHLPIPLVIVARTMVFKVPFFIGHVFHFSILGRDIPVGFPVIIISIGAAVAGQQWGTRYEWFGPKYEAKPEAAAEPQVAGAAEAQPEAEAEIVT